MNPTTRIVVTGHVLRVLVEGVLRDLTEQYSFSISEDESEDLARPLARLHQVRDGSPISFVYNADTTNLEQSREHKANLDFYFRFGAPPHLVLPFMPSVEVTLFRASVVQRWLERSGKSFARATHIAARVAPREMLEFATTLVPGSGGVEGFLAGIAEAEWAHLRKCREFTRLRAFVKKNAS